MLSTAEELALEQAIAHAERGSTGELRVVILKRCKGDPIAAARRHFHELGLDKTRGKSGALLLVSLKDHKAAIIGDEGIHAKVQDVFWQAVISRAIGHFANGELLLGILSAVHEIGAAFRKHLPPETTEGNELPNRPHYG